MKCVIIIVSFLCIMEGGYAQDTAEKMVENYIRYFNQGDIETKVRIIDNSLRLENVNMGPLYHEAVEFIIGNIRLLKTMPAVGSMIIASLKKIEEIPYREARYSVLKLVQDDFTGITRNYGLNALAVIAKGDRSVIIEMNEFLDHQNNLFLSQTKQDFHVVDTCIRTLGELGDKSSFFHIFTAYTLNYSEKITETARLALFKIEGTLKDNLLTMIETGGIPTRWKAFKFSLEMNELTDQEKREIVHRAMKMAVQTDSVVKEEHKIIREIRYRAIKEITAYSMSESSDLVVRHFEIVRQDYLVGRETKPNLIEAIDCLGNMGTHKAAKTLANYLEYINVYTETKRVYDEQIVVSVINNLAKLGDPVGIDPVQYAVFLNYSERVKRVAQEAADRLIGM
jgi:HEAT repeat protein